MDHWMMQLGGSVGTFNMIHKLSEQIILVQMDELESWEILFFQCFTSSDKTLKNCLAHILGQSVSIPVPIIYFLGFLYKTLLSFLDRLW